MIGQSPLVKMVVAVFLGAAVGLERELAGQPAGIRTHSLVALGSALFTIIALAYSQPPTGPAVPGETVRLVAALVTGIGFLGAGTIVRSGGTVAGLTTAASLWATAAIGLGAGGGFYLLAVAAVALVLLVLRGFSWLKTLLRPGLPRDEG